MRLHLSNELFIRDNNDRIFLWLKVTFNWTVNGGKKKKVSFFFVCVFFSKKINLDVKTRARERAREIDAWWKQIITQYSHCICSHANRKIWWIFFSNHWDRTRKIVFLARFHSSLSNVIIKLILDRELVFFLFLFFFVFVLRTMYTGEHRYGNVSFLMPHWMKRKHKTDTPDFYHQQDALTHTQRLFSLFDIWKWDQFVGEQKHIYSCQDICLYSIEKKKEYYLLIVRMFFSFFLLLLSRLFDLYSLIDRENLLLLRRRLPDQ